MKASYRGRLEFGEKMKKATRVGEEIKMEIENEKELAAMKP